MHRYTATIEWTRGDQAFTDNRYGRAHDWRFDGGARVRASSSPLVVKVPMSDPAAVDPEEAFVASISSCHMLFFLSFAARAGFRVDRDGDEAEGTMERDAEGKVAMTVVALHPRIEFSGDKRPEPADLDKLHHLAHGECFIANSVKTEVRVEPAEA